MFRNFVGGLFLAVVAAAFLFWQHFSHNFIYDIGQEKDAPVEKAVSDIGSEGYTINVLEKRVVREKISNVVVFAGEENDCGSVERLQKMLAKNDVSYAELMFHPQDEQYSEQLDKVIAKAPQLYVILKSFADIDGLLKTLEEKGNRVPIVLLND